MPVPRPLRLPRLPRLAPLAPTLLLALTLTLAGCAQPPTTAPPVPTPPTPTTSPDHPPSAAPLSWADLPPVHPLGVEQGVILGGNRIGTVPGNPQRFAYCATDGIHATQDGGASWQTIPIRGLDKVAPGLNFYLAKRGDTFTCAHVLPDPVRTDTFYADFPVAAAQYGAPPMFPAGFYTRDAGKTWQRVPHADDTPTTPAPFGDFRLAGNSVQALIGTRDLYATHDGGATWTPGQLTCPGSGPCVTFSAGPTSFTSCAMHAQNQGILSGEGLDPTLTVNACNGNQLVQRAAREYLLLSPFQADPPGPLVRLTRDAGQTWQPVDVPAIPGDAAGFLRQDLQSLPDGSLLAQVLNSPATWYLLPPGASAWCAAPAIPTAATRVTVIADRLWWIAGNGTDAKSQPASISLADLRCPGS